MKQVARLSDPQNTDLTTMTATFKQTQPHKVLVVGERVDQPLHDLLARHRFLTEYSVPATADEAHIAATAPDLVLLDAPREATPDVSLSSIIRAAKNTQVDLPVLLVADGQQAKRRKPTNGALQALIEDMLRDTGADDVIVRPFRDDDLVAHVSALIRVRERITALNDEARALREQLADYETRFRALEQKSRRSDEELSVLKDAIASTVSHELRTPMLHLKSSIHMLGSEVKDNPALVKLHHYATQSTSRLENIIDNISQLTTFSNLRPEFIRVADAISAAMRQLGRSWSSGGEIGRVAVDTPPAETPLVYADRKGIAQVLQQLIDNALKFDPQRGSVEVRTQIVEHGVWVAVLDRGIGVPDDQRERIFDRFYQVRQDSTRPFGGTGVGLAIVKLILDATRAPISVQARPGGGTIFAFVLPATKPEDDPALG
jgi:signal transduction histidine kinase